VSEVKLREEMKAAYSLIREYKAGGIQPGSAMTDEHQRLVRLLATDLDVHVDGLDIGSIVTLVASADTRWNRQTMDAVGQFYALSEGGSADAAAALRSDFLGRCPSVWYCGVLAGL
jgi:hypothetical protein